MTVGARFKTTFNTLWKEYFLDKEFEKLEENVREARHIITFAVPGYGSVLVLANLHEPGVGCVPVEGTIPLTLEKAK